MGQSEAAAIARLELNLSIRWALRHSPTLRKLPSASSIYRRNGIPRFCHRS